jgi:hypothetical protein
MRARNAHLARGYKDEDIGKMFDAPPTPWRKF